MTNRRPLSQIRDENFNNFTDGQMNSGRLFDCRVFRGLAACNKMDDDDDE